MRKAEFWTSHFTLIIGLLCLFDNPLFSQQLTQKQLVFEHFTKNQGLSSNQVNEFCQDREGFIWIATTIGLNKFDGYSFQTFKHKNNDSLSLVSNWINTIIESVDKESIWVGTDSGLDKFDKKTEIFEKTNIKSEVLDFFLDKENNLFVASTDGLYLKKEKETAFVKIASGRFHEIFKDSKGNHWVNKEFSFGILNLNEGVMDTFLRQVDIRTVVEDSKGEIWAGTKEVGLVRIEDYESKKIRFYNKENGYFATSSISDIIEESPGIYIIAVRDAGLYYLNTEKDTSRGFFMDKFDPKGLNSNALVSLFKDKWGNFWLGTYNKGINFLDKKRKPFLHYKMNFRENGLPNNNVRSIHQDNSGDIWIGTKERGCLSKFNYAQGTFKHYCQDENDPESISGDFILCIESAADPDFLWVGTYRGGLNYLNKKSGKSRHYKHIQGDSGSLGQDRVYVLYLDSKNQLWIGPRDGSLQAIKDPDGKFVSYIPEINANIKAPQNEIRAIFEDSEKTFWLGTNFGLSAFDYLKNEREIYIPDKEKTNTLSHPMITSIYEDSKKNFWIGTQNGLNIMDRKRGEFFAFSAKDGLPSSYIIGILEDNHGNLWLSTSNGLSKFTPPDTLDIDYLNSGTNRGEFRNYNVNDGLQDNEFSPNAYHKLDNGEMLFGGINGFNLFHPDSIINNTTLPQIHLTGLKIYNESVKIAAENSPIDKHINWIKQLELNHQQNGFTINFTALNFSSPEKVEYAYKLEGLEEKWNTVGKQRFAQYSHIAPGTYTFKVKACNNDGLWNNGGKSLKIIIHPPWYDTFWFKLLVIVTISGILFLIVRVRIDRLKHQKLKLEEMVEIRTREIQNQARELQQLTQKLQIQNEELNSHQEELSSQYEKLEESHTKLKNAQLQLVQSEKMASLGILTAGIAHEINNPINYIKSGIVGLKKTLKDILEILSLYKQLDPENNFDKQIKDIDLLKSEIKLDKKVELSEKILDNISNGATKTSEIIKGLNTFSRADDGKFQKYNVHDGLESTLLLLQHQLTENIIIKKEYGEIPLIHCFPSKLNQVFMNLLSNAIQAISDIGEITIKTGNYTISKQNSNEYISICIVDNGIGMDQTTIAHIFEPFFTTKEVGKGTGLGLSISLKIIDNHNGKIEVDSVKGKGTTFKIILPIIPKI